MREELPGVRELLVSLGNAVAGLAEEQRNTQRRLAVVEEIRSGSSSSMRTGREGVDAELMQVEVTELRSGTQFFRIGDPDRGEPRGSASDTLTLEDWVQEPMRLEDLPRDGDSVDPLGIPVSYGPEFNGGSQGIGTQTGARLQPLGPAFASAQACTDISAQVGARAGLLGPAIASAQVGARSGVLDRMLDVSAHHQEVRFDPSAQGAGSSMPGSEVRFVRRSGSAPRHRCKVQVHRCPVQRSGSAPRHRHKVQARRCPVQRSGSAPRHRHKVQARRCPVRRSGSALRHRRKVQASRCSAQRSGLA